jgi:thiosulfate reductase cytochrome b subunit
MRILIPAIAGLMLFGAVDHAGATYADRIISYRGAGEGKVVFDGRTHAARGLLCPECHPALFATKKQALITMKDHADKKACFACHDGTRAFAECGKCHRK